MSISINTSLFCLSLKYISKNYESISNISKWIYFELEKYNYKETKLIKSLDKKDFEIIKTLIKFSKNINLLRRYFTSGYKYIKIRDYDDIAKLLLNSIVMCYPFSL